MYSILRAKTDGMRSAMAGFAEDLFRLPSPRFHEAEVAARIEEEMSRLGYEKVDRDESDNIIGIRLGREGEPTILLASPMDTPEMDDSGAAGDSPAMLGAKAGIAAQVYAAAVLERSMLPLRGNLVVAATAAEVEGLGNGLRGLLTETLPAHDLSPTYAVLGEPTGLRLYYGHDGPDTVTGGTAGSSESLSGIRGVPGYGPGLGGESDPGEEGHPGLHEVGLLPIRHASAWCTDPFHPLMERARHALIAAGLNAKPGRWPAGCDDVGAAGRTLVSEFGIPTIAFGPNSPCGDLESLRLPEAAYGTAAIVHSLIGIPVCGWTSDEI